MSTEHSRAERSGAEQSRAGRMCALEREMREGGSPGERSSSSGVVAGLRPGAQGPVPGAGEWAGKGKESRPTGKPEPLH